MNNYARGRRKEYQVRDLFITKGYTVVRAAGSLGEIDLVAMPHEFTPDGASRPLMGDNQVIAIQVKSKKFTKKERAKLNKLREELHPVFSIQAWVVLDRQEPKMEFSL